MNPTNASVYLVLKAYISRVGGKISSVSLIKGDIADEIRETGGEYGTTTNRPRDVAWFDAVMAERAMNIIQPQNVVLTKLDVLTGIDPLCICTKYRRNGEKTIGFPLNTFQLPECQPVYRILSGWSEDIRGITEWDHLPVNAKKYVLEIEKFLGQPIKFIGTGPGREEMIVRW